jgi:hypothetical protein
LKENQEVLQPCSCRSQISFRFERLILEIAAGKYLPRSRLPQRIAGCYYSNKKTGFRKSARRGKDYWRPFAHCDLLREKIKTTLNQERGSYWKGNAIAKAE